VKSNKHGREQHLRRWWRTAVHPLLRTPPLPLGTAARGGITNAGTTGSQASGAIGTCLFYVVYEALYASTASWLPHPAGLCWSLAYFLSICTTALPRLL
jgi:hypothetical protein